MWFKVSNDTNVPRLVIVEPWADEVLLQPGETVGVFWHGPADGYFDVHEGATETRIWAEGSRDVLLEFDKEGRMAREVGQGVHMPPRYISRGDLPDEER